jgi:hypothetical protein
MKENTFAYNYTIFELHPTLISKIVELTGCRSYLELGVLQGLNIKEVSKYCNRCIGVDINDILIFRDFEFHKKATDEFFNEFKERVDIVFIDADHHFEQVKKDFINSLNCLNQHGIIFIHDTDPYEEKYLEQMYCGDSYKMHDWIKENYQDLNLITLPIGVAGITIVTRNNDRRTLKFLKK